MCRLIVVCERSWEGVLLTAWVSLTVTVSWRFRDWSHIAAQLLLWWAPPPPWPPSSSYARWCSQQAATPRRGELARGAHPLPGRDKSLACHQAPLFRSPSRTTPHSCWSSSGTLMRIERPRASTRSRRSCERYAAGDAQAMSLCCRTAVGALFPSPDCSLHPFTLADVYRGRPY